MKENELIAIDAAVQSLCDSTEVEYIAQGVRAKVAGRCSPLISHRKVEYEHAEHSYNEPRVMLAAYNGGNALIVLDSIVATDLNENYWIPEKPHWDGYARALRWHVAPTCIVEPLLNEVKRWLPGCTFYLGTVVKVGIWMRVLAGFDDQGAPQYVRYVVDTDTGEADAEVY